MSKKYIIKEKLKRILNENPESLFPHFANNEFLSMWWVSSTPFGIPFLYQFHSRIEALVCSSFANDYTVNPNPVKLTGNSL